MGSTIADLAASLSKTRDYAVDARSWPEDAETIVAAAAEKIRAFGFCVVDYAVSADDALVGAVHDEVWAATQLIEAAGGGDRAQDQAGFGGGGDVGVETEVQLQPTCELIHLPQFSAAMASGPVSSIARAVLDDHVRLTRTHTRHVPPDFPEDGQPSNDRPMPSGRKKRGWVSRLQPMPPLYPLSSRRNSTRPSCRRVLCAAYGLAARSRGARRRCDERGRPPPPVP
jgi:hypothetical protein